MKKSLIYSMCLLICLLPFAGCMVHKHVVGNGGKGGVPVSEMQWYVLWGLVPLNNVDTNAMAGGASDYTVTTQTSFIDFLISIVTGYVSIYPRDVSVSK